MLVSPAEPAELRALGTVSSVPERYGADFLYTSALGRIGVQRKEIHDLIASLADERVGKEIGQLRSLEVGIWLIEGHLSWTSDGLLLSSSRSPFTKAQYLGICWSLQSSGFWLAHTGSQTETIEYLLSLGRWVTKPRHTSLLRRPSPKGVWGEADSYEWQVHMMQGFPGIGYEKAKAIVDYYGRLPFTVDVDLTDVPGIGKGIAKRVKEAVDGTGGDK